MAVLQVCRLYVTTGYYSYYGHYKLRGIVTWFADSQGKEVYELQTSLTICFNPSSAITVIRERQ